jgi:hypothetical protein
VFLQADHGGVTGVETHLGKFHFFACAGDAITSPAPWMFTDNETNCKRLYGTENKGPYVGGASTNMPYCVPEMGGPNHHTVASLVLACVPSWGCRANT